MITVRVLEMARPAHSQQRGYASKLNRDPEFLQELIDLGLRQADEFLAAQGFETAWHSGDADAVLAYFAEDCEFSATAPLRHQDPTSDAAAIRALVTERLTTRIEINFNRLQLARETVTWKVRTASPDSGSQIDGTAAVMFSNGKVVSFVLGP
jgi:NTE family protein